MFTDIIRLFLHGLGSHAFRFSPPCARPGFEQSPPGGIRRGNATARAFFRMRAQNRPACKGAHTRILSGQVVKTHGPPQKDRANRRQGTSEAILGKYACEISLRSVPRGPFRLIGRPGQRGSMAISIYGLKPAFTRLLRPVAGRLAAAGWRANHVTLAACILSCGLGLALYVFPDSAPLWALLPVWLFLRMALNAVDGIMARDYDQKSRLGALLNEMGDVVADAALVVPFAAVPGFSVATAAVFAWMALLTEFAGVLGLSVGAGRRYDGPMGKSDRAFCLGVGALLVVASLVWSPPVLRWVEVGFWLCSALMALTAYNRLRGGLLAH